MSSRARRAPRNLISALVAMLAACAAPAGDSPAPASPPAEPLRVMSFNVRRQLGDDGPNDWSHRRGLVAAVIRASRAAVVGVQEALPGQRRDLLADLPDFDAIDGNAERDNYAVLTPILVDRRRLEVEEQGAFWLSPTPERFSRGWDARFPTTCTWAVLRDRARGHRFALLNAHFDSQGPTAREESAKLVAERISRLAPLPVLLTGDLNALVTAPPLQLLRDAGLRDSFRVLHPDARDVRTVHMFRGDGGGSRKIDYVLCDASWTVLAASIDRTQRDGRFPSDHFPVLAEVTPRLERSTR